MLCYVVLAVLCEAGTSRECVKVVIPERSLTYRSHDRLEDHTLDVACCPMGGTLAVGEVTRLVL